MLGITYDASNDSFWISGWSTNQVTNYTRGGTILSSFLVSFFPNNLTSLALDAADGTLWMGSQSNQGTFAQYTRVGALVSSFSDALLTG